MLKNIFLMTFLFGLMTLFGCSGGSSEAPTGGNAHPDNWLALHGAEALFDLRGCQGCHGFDFNGSGAAASCFSCHPSGPPFSLHPASWTDVVADHQDFANDFSWTVCAVAICHGTDLQGGNGPTCFSAACHFNTGGDPVPTWHREVNFNDPTKQYTDPDNHGAVAKASQDLCLHCHGRPVNTVDGGYISDPDIMNNLDVNNAAVIGNCRTCHPDAGAHPTNWQGSVDDIDPNYTSSHRGIDLTTQSRSCNLCHDVSGTGVSAVASAPSCFTASHTNANAVTTDCHPGGPRTAPHATDGSYRVSTAHGKDAKLDLTACQSCHADNPAAGPGDNPRFNSPIGSLADGCESAGCHSPYYAHPDNWAGPNTSFHYSSGKVANACTLCHGSALDGIGGINAAGGTPGQSCLACHSETAAFTLDCAACHGYPPDGVTPEPIITNAGGTLVNHNNTANVISADVSSGSAGSAHDTCLVCHGVKANGAASGCLSPAAEYNTFDPITDTLGDHWNGQINMNGPSGTGAGYNETNFGCDNAGCHGNDANHRLSSSTFPVAYGDFGNGAAAAPHALDGSFLLPANHGPTAKADLAACKSCHGEAVNINPRYNVGISNPAATNPGNGCEGCHNDLTAHPSQGAREAINWYDTTWRHATGRILAATCGMCHPRTGWVGTVGPACTSCHVSDPANVAVGSCTSCHAAPPNGAVQPNRNGNNGRHSRGAHREACSVCHTNNGPGSAEHFTRPNPGYSRANLRTTPNVSGATMTIDTTTNAPNVTCTGTCHGEGHNESWY